MSSFSSLQGFLLFLFTRNVDIDNFFYIFYVDVDSLGLWHYHHGSLSPVPPASLTLIDADGIELSETAGDYPFAWNHSDFGDDRDEIDDDDDVNQVRGTRG